MEDFSGLSARSSLFSESDDFSGNSLIHPFFPEDYKPGYLRGQVTVSEYSQTGCGTTVLPGVTIGAGAVTGAHTLVTKDLAAWGIYVGSPARLYSSRSQRVVDLAKDFIQTLR